MRTNWFAIFVVLSSPSTAVSEFIILESEEVTGLAVERLGDFADCEFPNPIGPSKFEMEMTQFPDFFVAGKVEGSFIFEKSPLINLTFDGVVSINRDGTLGSRLFWKGTGGRQSRKMWVQFAGDRGFHFRADYDGCLIRSEILEDPYFQYELTIFPIGDSNLDGVFNSGDLVDVFVAGKYASDDGDAHWTEGDWNGDFVFDSSDLVAAFQFGNYSRTAQPVPEPSLGLAAVFGCLLIYSGHRRLRRISHHSHFES